MTRDDLFDKLRPIVLQATGIPDAILADPNAPAPNGPYATIEPELNVTGRGQANIHRRATGWGTTETVVKSQLINEVQVNFYRGNARTYAKKLKQCNKRPSISAMLHDADLAWFNTSSVLDTTALQSDQREQRSTISIFIGYEMVEIPEVGNSIESVKWTVFDPENNELGSGEAVVPKPSDTPEGALVFGGVPLVHNGAYLIHTVTQ